MKNVEKNPKTKLTKQQMLAKALRENLKKRKIQATLRQDTLSNTQSPPQEATKIENNNQ